VGATSNFNLDHVAVGPTGYGRGNEDAPEGPFAGPGFKECEVVFDGSQIVWPWGEDTDSLKQAALAHAGFKNGSKDMTGKTLGVSAVIALPGYLCHRTQAGPGARDESQGAPGRARKPRQGRALQRKRSTSYAVNSRTGAELWSTEAQPVRNHHQGEPLTNLGQVETTTVLISVRRTDSTGIPPSDEPLAKASSSG